MSTGVRNWEFSARACECMYDTQMECMGAELGLTSRLDTFTLDGSPRMFLRTKFQSRSRVCGSVPPASVSATLIEFPLGPVASRKTSSQAHLDTDPGPLSISCRAAVRHEFNTATSLDNVGCTDGWRIGIAFANPHSGRRYLGPDLCCEYP